jgi:hypothetical protein
MTMADDDRPESKHEGEQEPGDDTKSQPSVTPPEEGKSDSRGDTGAESGDSSATGTGPSGGGP